MAADLVRRSQRLGGRLAAGIALWLLCAGGSASAQPPVASDYKVGRADVLVIATMGRPEVSGQFIVDDTGAITFPLLGRVEVAGLPSAAVAERLRERLASGFLNEPQVSVRVAEFKSQRVLVMGEVRNPGSYPLTGQTTVLGIIAQAGSTTQEAGGEILIRRANQPTKVPPSMDGGEAVIHLDLTRLETGRIPDNVILGDGDTVFVPRSEQVFVFGEVRSPGAYRLRTDMTVLQALALAGGVTEGAATNRVSVERVEGGKRKSLKVKLSDLVQPGDTIVVPERVLLVSGRERDGTHLPTPGGHDGTGAGDWHLIDYLRVLVKRRWTALSVFAAVVISARVALSMATPMYEARTQVLIEAESQPIVMFKEMVAQERASDQFYETQFKILQSRALARATVEALNGWDNPEWGAPDGKPGRIRGLFDGAIGFARRILGMPVVTKSVPPPDAAETTDQSRIIYGFLRRLEIAPVPNSHLVDIKFQSPDPKLAATAANALARQYIQRNLDFKFAASKEATDWLTDQLAEQRTRVEQGEQALQRYREQNQTLTDDNQNILTQKLNDATAALNRARSKRIEKETVFRQISQARDEKVNLADVPAVANTPGVKLLVQTLDELRRRRARLSQELGERHPEMVELRNSILREESRLKSELEAAAKLVESDYAAARAEEENFSKALDAQKAEAAFASRGDSSYQTIARDIAGSRQIFESLLQRTRETGISSEMNTNNIRIVDEADEPRSPVWPPRRQYTMLAMLIGSVAALGLAFFAEYADNKIKSPDEVQQHLGLLCLGLVPQVSGPSTMESGPLIHNEVPAKFAESFRKIRSNVIFAMSERRQRTIIVTSTGPNEGKTTIATNLAIGLAMTQQRVLLIDADMRRSRVDQVLNQDPRPGLSELLTERCSWDQVVQPYDTHQQLTLDVMLAGTEPDNPTELLSSSRCKAMLARASRDYDWVIVDSPPVLAVTDASILANTPSDVLFVVGSEINRLQTITRALEQLEVAKASFVGAVLNRARIDRNSFYYSDYIRKEYGEYYGGTKRSARSLGRFFTETVSRSSRS